MSLGEYHKPIPCSIQRTSSRYGICSRGWGASLVLNRLSSSRVTLSSGRRGPLIPRNGAAEAGNSCRTAEMNHPRRYRRTRHREAGAEQHDQAKSKDECLVNGGPKRRRSPCIQIGRHLETGEPDLARLNLMENTGSEIQSGK